MKICKKLLTIGTSIMMITSIGIIGVNADAPQFPTSSEIVTLEETSGNVGLSTNPSYLDDESKDGYKPLAVWDLIDDGLYYVSGSTYSAPLYTNYLFTGSTTMGVGIRSLTNNNVIVRVYKRNFFSSDEEITHFTVPANGYAHKAISGLSSSSKYYVRFGYPCTIEGYVNDVVLPFYFS
ncbi:MAG: hypothetical protein K6G88_02965 [Lachnospiraceae bacterium]|nr:hypothetical protein [Lachnospiraceae bacterium]